MATDAAPLTSADHPGTDRGSGEMPASRMRRLRFWTAVAGMAVAVMIAIIVVAIEMISMFGLRSSHSHARVMQLQSRLTQAQTRLTAANHKIAELRRRSDAMVQFNRILAAPDSRLIRLRLEHPGAEVAGVVAVSRQLKAAVIALQGPPGPGMNHFEARWIISKGAPQSAGRFDAVAGTPPPLAANLILPPPNAIALMVLATDAHQPGVTPILLQGELPRAPH